MAKIIRMFFVMVLLGALTIQADPIIDTNYAKATHYTNGLPMDNDDVFTESFMCGDTSGGPYTVEIIVTTPGAPPSSEDFAPCVTGPGTYYFRGQTRSQKYNEVSALSAGELNFTVTAQDLGYVPNPPVL